MPAGEPEGHRREIRSDVCIKTRKRIAGRQYFQRRSRSLLGFVGDEFS
jgi:hypothetical protein